VKKKKREYNFNGLKETPTSLQKKKKSLSYAYVMIYFCKGVSSLQDAQPMTVTYNLRTKKLHLKSGCAKQ